MSSEAHSGPATADEDPSAAPEEGLGEDVAEAEAEAEGAVDPEADGDVTGAGVSCVAASSWPPAKRPATAMTAQASNARMTSRATAATMRRRRKTSGLGLRDRPGRDCCGAMHLGYGATRPGVGSHAVH